MTLQDNVVTKQYSSFSEKTQKISEMSMDQKLAALHVRFNYIKGVAERAFNVDLAKVELRVDLKGYSLLGQAIKKDGELSIRINIQGVEFYFEDMLNDTLAHEVAHTVQYAKGDRGGHGRDWKYYCSELGGRPTTIAKGDYSLLKPARKMRQWDYGNTVSDEVFQLSTIRHNKLQRGKVQCYVCKGSVGEITKNTFIGESI